ncbi:MAG: EamA family transporter [Oscillatoriales cyanobacterium C42_A2020_001]|nr:EamA family transporter [Leptolyngbyaceae cyanobacterium C42_A2020_001]
MEPTENRPDNRIENGRTVESVLQTVTQDLKRLHQGLITQLSQEVTQLQTEKARLLSEVQKLQAQHQKLQAQNENTLSQQQVAQQQLWAKQLALALSNHLQGLMMQQISQTAKANQVVSTGELSISGDSAAHSQNAHRLLASLDSTFTTTFKALQQELNSYESSLSQQINRMHNLEQQGEAVLEALVDRLRQQLQAETTKTLHLTEGYSVSTPPARENGNPGQAVVYDQIPQVTPSPQGFQFPPQSDSYSPAIAHSAASQFSPASARQTQPTPSHAQQYPAPTPLAVPATAVPAQAATKKDTSNFWVGLVLVLLSTVALSIHNVLVRVIGKPSSILGAPEIGGFINITILGNSLLILWLRMLIVLPLMVGVAMFLYPPVWRDLKKFFSSRDRRPVLNVVGSGFFLFLSQVLIYIAIGQIGAGPAVTILFMYPIVTVPLAWLLFGDRPTSLRWGVMAVILTGVILTALPSITNAGKGWSLEGVVFAICSGIAFALYLIFMQLGFKKLHPVPVSLVQFFTIFVLSAVILIAVGPNLGVQVLAEQRAGFVLSGALLGVLTLIGYLANNFGVRFMGAGLASIVASIGPVMTAFLAWILIQNKLQGVQWFGILLVTLGVGALSFERMKLQARKK